MSLLLVLSTILFVGFLYYLWMRRHLYDCSLQLPGPLAWPILGNGLEFAGGNDSEYHKNTYIFMQ
jgi:hypothetical protein